MNTNPPPSSDILDLSVTGITPNTINLHWSAPDGGSSTLLAYGYDLRYSQISITDRPGSPPPRPSTSFLDSSLDALIREEIEKPTGDIHASDLAGMVQVTVLNLLLTGGVD